MSANFTTTIRESSCELTARERIKVKDTSSAIQLDELVTETDPFIFSPKDYAIIDVHNENSKSDKDYTKYIIIATDGKRYITGSETLFRNFIDIFTEMRDIDEDYEIEVYKKPSKNYTGKTFLTCALV